SPAAGAEPAPLAAEGHQLLGVAAVAADTQEPVFQAPALQVLLELPLHVPRQRPALPGQVRQELGIPALNGLVEGGRFRLVAGVADGGGAGWRHAPSEARTALLASGGYWGGVCRKAPRAAGETGLSSIAGPRAPDAEHQTL